MRDPKTEQLQLSDLEDFEESRRLHIDEHMVPWHSRGPILVKSGPSFTTIFMAVFWALVCWTLVLLAMAIIFLQTYEPTTSVPDPIKKDKASCATCSLPSVSA